MDTREDAGIQGTPARVTSFNLTEIRQQTITQIHVFISLNNPFSFRWIFGCCTYERMPRTVDVRFAELRIRITSRDSVGRPKLYGTAREVKKSEILKAFFARSWRHSLTHYDHTKTVIFFFNIYIPFSYFKDKQFSEKINFR